MSSGPAPSGDYASFWLSRPLSGRRPRVRDGGQQAVELCPAAGLRAVGDVQLAIDVRQVELDRLLGDPQHLRQLRSEEHTSELQSRENLVCRLLLEKKKK